MNDLRQRVRSPQTIAKPYRRWRDSPSIAIAVLSIVLLTPVLSGCHGKQVDGSSPEALETSLQRIGADLSPAEADELQAAIMVLSLDGLSLAEIGDQDIDARIAAALDGLTVEEIVARAAEVRAARVAAEQAQLRRDIEDLERRKSEAEQAGHVLVGFVVDSSRFVLAPQRYGRAQPQIHLSVRNNTGAAVARAYFRGIVATPGRAVPWIDEEFNYSVPGGLEHGESTSWVLEPNMFSDWGSIDVPSDAVMTVEVVDLDGADGQSLLGTARFTEYDAERLVQLRGLLVHP